MATVLFDPIKTMARMTRRVAVLYSGGKDSAVVLDLCAKHFDEVHAYMFYWVKGLSTQERLRKWAEEHYGITLQLFPHWGLSAMLRYGAYREEDPSVPRVTPTHLLNHIRRETGCQWIAGGERIKDSIWRNAMIKKSGSICDKKKRFYPVAYWTKQQVLGYLKHYRIPFTEVAEDPMYIACMKDELPDDYQKVKAYFPWIDVYAKRRYKALGLSEVPH